MISLPLAHAGHYLWAIYIPPALVVIWSIGRSIREQRRERREKEESER
ncbi:MAG: hypothetical protein QOJ38_1569 [Solirubrobacterales bacterium]|nr:hypothetical protein [Solirubrobacterales bacterium]